VSSTFSEVESSDEMSTSPTLTTINGNNHHHHHHHADDNTISTLKRTTLGRSDAKRLHRKLKKYQIGEATDDVRLCIMCLRAIMNNQVCVQYPCQIERERSFFLFSTERTRDDFDR
jgi:hypothetical protein